MPKTIRYDGPIDAVDVPLPSGIVVRVARGETAQLPDATAERLLEQDCWSTPTPDVKAPKGAKSGDAPQED